VQGPEPIRLLGSIPYAFPFMTQQPADDKLNVQVQVRDQGLAVLNVLTDQLAWVEGQGEVKLNIAGTLQQPQVQGTATLQSATFTTPTLPDFPLTNVQAEVQFDFDRLNIKALSAQFSDGQILATGSLPIFRPLANLSPLAVELQNLAMNLRGLYRGGVEGLLQVSGSALAPKIGGEVALSHGRIALPNNPRALSHGNGSAQNGSSAANPGTLSLFQPELSNLQLRLGDNVQIVKQPLLAFGVDGTLAVNGPLTQLKPSGTVELRSGQVNLVSTFRLQPTYNNRAIFVPDQGLDPNLDLQLVTSVTEVNRGQIAPVFSSTEVADPTVLSSAGFQTVRIFATVNGPASQLMERIVLSSKPNRSQTEIISLLGGGFAENLSQGDSTLALANLAGSTILGSLQGLVANALGLSEFRLFPAAIVDAEQGDRRSTDLGIGVEVGVDVTRHFSVSIQDILNANQNLQLNLRYRVNDQLLLRTSSDFVQDTRGVIEYETRF
jgi:translocation and assembly module TamB